VKPARSRSHSTRTSARSSTWDASALDRAHKSGIAHRDLKPGNVMLTKSGIKLIDFGLARSIAPTVPASGSEAATATAHAALTGEGAIVGTPQYMAPEQLEGKPADARTDVFALGGVLHEMVAGKPAFSGVSAATLASEILRTEAPPLTTLRAECPPALERVVRACLVKDPDERLQSAHDVKLLLEGLTDVARASVQPRADARRATWRPWAVAAFATSLAVAALLRKTPAPAAATGSVRFQVLPPAGGIFTGWSEATTFSFSPDGRTLAFSAVEGGITRLYLRPLASLEGKPVPGSEGGRSAFWSPDGKALAFFANSQLKRLELSSGAPVTVCNVRPGAGITGTWGADGQILFASIEGEGIFGVKSEGGEPRKLLDPAPGTLRVSWPSFLPDGRRFLYLQRSSERDYRSPRLKRRDLATGETRSLLPEGAFQIARDYTPDGTTLVYGERDQGSWDLFTVPAGGGQGQPLLRTPFDEFDLRLSPDGRYAAFVSNETGRPEVYVAPFPRLAERVRATQKGARAPHWSHDGRELTFITADLRLVSLPVRTTPSLELGAERALFALEGRFGWAAYDVARDGRFLAIVTEALSGEVPITVVLDPFAAPHDAARP
jgi:Protein kinase domain/WD40-like Beta Propeller Repeat